MVVGGFNTLDIKLAKPDGLVKSDAPHKTGVPVKPDVSGKSTMPLHSEPAQKAAFDGPQSRPSSAAIPLLNTAVDLGFPKDALSAALLVFTRFFSLSADKALIGSLRREILGLIKTSSPGSAEEKAALEARAMAAVIATDKGVFLTPGALERYARFLTQTSFITGLMPRTSGDKESPSSKTAAAPQDSREKSLGKSSGKSRGESEEEIPEPDELKAIAETQMREDGFLDLLNYLPGKNGQYWLVFPFDVNVRGIELKVLLRVLTNEGGSIPGTLSSAEDGQLIADISGPKRQWRCFLRKTAGKLRADIRVYPEYPERALDNLRKQVERFLGKDGGIPPSKDSRNFSGFEEIIVRNGDRIPLWEEDLWPDHLPFVDKEV